MSYWPPVLLFFLWNLSVRRGLVSFWTGTRLTMLTSIIHHNGLTKFFLSPNICFVTILLFTCNMNPITEIKGEISQCLGLFLESYRKCYEIHSRSLQTLLILESSNVQSTEPMEIGKVTHTFIQEKRHTEWSDRAQRP